MVKKAGKNKMVKQSKVKKVKKAVSTTKKVADNLSVPVFNQKGEKLKTINLPSDIFGQKSNANLVSMASRVYLANQKQKTPSSKTRAEVSGGGRKPYRQKGTGRARAGSTRAGGRVGGGVIFGPRPSETELKLPKKMKLKALAVSLSDKLKDTKIYFVDKVAFKEPKTKKASELISLVTKSKRPTLVILEGPIPEVVKSFRNIERAGTTLAVDLNALDVVKFPSLIFTLDALEKLKSRFGDKNG